MVINFEDGAYGLIPERTLPASSTTTGSRLYNKLCLGVLTETWSKTTRSGVTFSCNGNHVVSCIYNNQTIFAQTFNTTYEYVFLSIYEDLSVIRLRAYGKSSGYRRSSGRYYYHFFGVDGDAGQSATYPTLTEYLQAVENAGGANTVLFSYINLSSNNIGGVFEWSNMIFANSGTTLEEGITQYTQIQDNIRNILINDITEDPTNADPYEQGGISDTGGGTGNFDLTSDQIDVSNVPTLSAVDTGLVTLYTPTLAQLQSLARYLWNADATTIDWWKKLIANPLDLILGLSIVPVAVPQGTTENVYVGLIDTGIAMTKAASQYVQVDCGSLNVTEFYGAALDYLPFRKTSIYLPFIGTRTISTDDIMGKTVHVVYNIDLLSGALTAMVKCGDAVLYQYSGACNIAIPLSGQSFTDLALSTLQLAAGIGATVASGGSAAGIVAANAANSVMSMKPTVERAGGVSGAAGQLAIMRPYLIGEIPRQSVPANYNQFAGYPSNISAVLGNLSGYTQVETIYLEGITATSDELNEIETLLKSGVYI